MITRLPIDPLARFWSKVDKRPGHGPDGECWVWTGGVTGVGFGYFWDGWRNVLAHVFAWQLDHGRVPSDCRVLQQCGNRLCMRHLYVAAKTNGKTPGQTCAFPLTADRNVIRASNCRARKDARFIANANSNANRQGDIAAKVRRQETSRDGDAILREMGKR